MSVTRVAHPKRTKQGTGAGTPMPASPKKWLAEIADAFADAAETIPFGPFTGVEIKAGDLFHLGPAVCLKFRGIKATKAKLKKATEAALTSYVATKNQEPEALSLPHVAFAFCYLGAHFGLDILTDGEVATIMDYVAEHERQLMRLAEQRLEGRGP